MKFDDILRNNLGEFGRYQKWVCFVVSLFTLPVTMTGGLNQLFLGGAMAHWCDVASWRDVNCTAWGLTEAQCTQAKRDASTPVNVSDEQIAQACYKYAIVDELEFEPGLNASSYNNTNITTCNEGWVYDRSQFRSSIVSEFDLVCDNEDQATVAQSMFFVGILIGSILFPNLADIYGRRKVVMITGVVDAVLAVVTALSPSFWFFALMTVAGGATSMGVFVINFVIVTEYVGPSKRRLTGLGYEFFYAAGYMLIPLFAYFFRNWRTLQFVTSVPQFLKLALLPFMPESSRWLLSKGRVKEAEQILQKMAKINGTKLPDPIFTEEDLKEVEDLANARKPTAIELFRTPILRIRTLNLMFNWFVNTLVYYGLSLSTSDLGVNIYVAFFIAGAVEVPANLSAIFAIELVGRRWSLFGYMVAGGIACLCTILTPPGPWRTAVAMLGKFGITASFSIIYLFSAEIFPTPIRGVGLGVCSMNARVAGIIAPFILLLNRVWGPLPVVIFSTASIIAGLLVLALPETRGQRLPETIMEGETFGTKRRRRDENGTKVVYVRTDGAVSSLDDAEKVTSSMLNIEERELDAI